MKFLTPLDYPAYLMALLRETVDPGKVKDDFEFLLDEHSKGKRAWSAVYKAAMKDWRRLYASPYIFAARGLSGLSYDTLAMMRAIVAPRGDFGDEMPVSMNIATAAGFAAPTREGERGPAVMSVLVTYKLPPGNVRSHGGDSESGPLNEAELRASKCEGCVDRIFIGGQRSLLPRMPAATDLERRRYCLSMYLKASRPGAWDAIRFPVAFAKDLTAWSRTWHGYRVRVIRTPAEHARAEQLGPPTVPADWGWWRYK